MSRGQPRPSVLLLQPGMLHQGYLRVARLAGIDLKVHWSFPVGALIFTRARFEPVLWLSFAVIIVVHELGHAAAVKAVGFTVSGIDVTGLGGHCRFRGRASELERAWIAWGGVVAQMLLLLVVLVARAIWGAPESRAGLLASEAFVGINLWIAALNLVPVRPLDGADAWRLFGELERSGWTLRGLLLRSLQRWARDRRATRLSSNPPPAEAKVAPPPEAKVPPRAEAVRAPNHAAEAEASAAEQSEREAPKPSAQAQRELAALLERIGDEAGKAKRRR